MNFVSISTGGHLKFRNFDFVDLRSNFPLNLSKINEMLHKWKKNNYEELIHNHNRHYLILLLRYLVEIVYFYPLFQYMIRIERSLNSWSAKNYGAPFLRLKKPIDMMPICVGYVGYCFFRLKYGIPWRLIF